MVINPKAMIHLNYPNITQKMREDFRIKQRAVLENLLKNHDETFKNLHNKLMEK